MKTIFQSLIFNLGNYKRKLIFLFALINFLPCSYGQTKHFPKEKCMYLVNTGKYIERNEIQTTNWTHAETLYKLEGVETDSLITKFDSTLIGKKIELKFIFYRVMTIRSKYGMTSDAQNNQKWENIPLRTDKVGIKFQGTNKWIMLSDEALVKKYLAGHRTALRQYKKTTSESNVGENMLFGGGSILLGALLIDKSTGDIGGSISTPVYGACAFSMAIGALLMIDMDYNTCLNKMISAFNS